MCDTGRVAMSDGVCGACNKAMCEDCYTKCMQSKGKCLLLQWQGQHCEKKAGFVKLAHTASYYC